MHTCPQLNVIILVADKKWNISIAKKVELHLKA